jgi:hypothetical protein
MRLLDTYAVSSGSKIDKPFIFEQYFPLVYDKYITIQAQTKYESKDYSYWQDVINVLFPILDKHGIKIIQVGGPNELLYQYVVDLRGKTDVNQLAYVIKGAMLHLGSDSLGVHLASYYDIPIVGLYSVSQSSVSGPQFGTKEKQICIDAYLRTRTGKPSYSDKEAPKCVDLVMPEELVDSVFSLLNLNVKTPFKTIFIGSRYSGKIFRELIPTKAFPIADPNNPIEIRMDIHFDEDVLAQQLSYCRGIIITNKPIKKELIKNFRGNINAIVYMIEENDDPNFIAEIKDLSIPIILMTYLSDEQIQPKKINYYEHGNINMVRPEQEEKHQLIKENFGKLYFRSNKIVTQDGKIFNGHVSRIKGTEISNDFDYYEAADIPEFWKDLPFLTLVKMNESSEVQS